MNRHLTQACVGIIVATVIWLCGYFFGLFGAHPPTKETDAATWASAFGAFLAFVGAIGIAARQIWREDREKRARARIYAPAIALQLTWVRPILSQAIDGLSSPVLPLSDVQKYWGREFARAKVWGIDEMEAVLCLPNDCAVSLALVKEIMRVTGEAMSDGGEYSDVTETIAQIQAASAHAESAAIELQNIVDKQEAIHSYW